MKTFKYIIAVVACFCFFQCSKTVSIISENGDVYLLAKGSNHSIASYYKQYIKRDNKYIKFYFYKDMQIENKINFEYIENIKNNDNQIYIDNKLHNNTGEEENILNNNALLLSVRNILNVNDRNSYSPVNNIEITSPNFIDYIQAGKLEQFPIATVNNNTTIEWSADATNKNGVAILISFDGYKYLATNKQKRRKG
jgi:hypothetical protein